MRVLLLSAYAAASHRHWSRALQVMFPEWSWQVLELAPRHFAWRVRGNPLLWLGEQAELLRQPYDLVIATSMVDLATLRGLVPALARVPSLLYFHENQFAYPDNQSRHAPLEAQMVSIYAALAADRLAFNSAYNRDTFIAGVKTLFGKLPDRLPAELVDSLVVKAHVLPVPLDTLQVGAASRERSGPLKILWNHRWEYDKGPDRLLTLVRQLEVRGCDFQLALAGQQFRQTPPALEQLSRDFAHRITHQGYVEDRQAYESLLGACDLALSTALHDFQGLAVQEAAAAGCRVLVPDRLAYPEFFPEACRYPSLPDDPEAEALSLAALIASGGGACADMGPVSMDSLAPAYRSLLGAVAAARDSH